MVDALLGAAHGLPLLVEELLTGLVERGVLQLTADGWVRAGELVLEVPAGLAELVGDRLDRLAVPGREVLQAAAVAGDQIDHRLLAEVVDVAEPAVLGVLRAGVESNLLSSDGARLVWRHALTRDAVLATLLPPERAAVAARIADRLDRRGDDEARRRAAHLWADAGRPDRAVPALVAVARAAADRGELGTAESLVRRAGALGGEPAVAEELVRLLTLQGRLAEARSVGSASLDALAGAAHASLALTLAEAAVEAADWAGAFELLDRAGAGDGSHDLRADAIRADALFGSGDLPRAAALAESVVAAADAAGAPAVDPGDLCTALEVAGRCARASDQAAARRWFGRAAQVAAEHGLTPRRVRALHSLGTLELNEGAVSPRLVEARDLAEAVGMPGTVAGIDIVLAEAELTRYGPAPAVARATRQRRARHQDRPAVGARHRRRCWPRSRWRWPATTRPRAGCWRRWGTPIGPDDKEGLVRAVHAVRPLLAHEYDEALAELDAATASLGRNPAGAPVSRVGALGRAARRAGRRPGRGRGAAARCRRPCTDP